MKRGVREGWPTERFGIDPGDGRTVGAYGTFLRKCGLTLAQVIESIGGPSAESRPFEEARAFARSLNLTRVKEWREFTKTAARPSDIPTDPHRFYADRGWSGYGDWLGTGRVRERDFLPFKDARTIVHALKLKSEKQWREYLRSGRRPNDIPSDPRAIYGSEFKGLGDWLGTGRVADRDREFWPFIKARRFARALQLRNLAEWAAYSKSGKRPEYIPFTPSAVYGAKYKGLGDWLGTGNESNRYRNFLPFTKARKQVRSLGLKSSAEWSAYCTSGKKPKNIPAALALVYGAQFKGMGDWLGTGTIAPQNYKFLPFTKARHLVRALKLRTVSEWHRYCKSGKKPGNIPQKPSRTYAAQFRGMGDWLGTGAVADHLREYKSFREARAFVHALGLKSRSEWFAYCQSGRKPDDIPREAHRTYASEFKGMADWLGSPTVKPVGESHGMAKLDWNKVERLRELHRQGWNGARLAKRFGVGPTTVSRIVKNENWRPEDRP